MALPRVQPIIPTWRREPFDDPEWLFEFKYDGFRGLCVMLGHDLHPLLADQDLLCLLNEAVETRWNSVTGAPAVSFRADRIVCDDPLKIENA